MNCSLNWASFRHPATCAMILVSLAQLGCDARTSNESPVVENAEVQVPQPTEVHLPVSFASGDTSRYRVLATTKRGVRFFPRLSSIEPKESTTEFGLVFKVTSVEADGVILAAHVDYVATRANVGTMLFSIDTRQNLTQMNDMSAGDYEIKHPGLRDLDHPLNASWRVFKAITEEPFQIYLDRDGGFMELQGYAPKTGDADSLNLLAPGRLAMMLCLMLPPHQPEYVSVGDRWTGQCNGQSTSFEIARVSSNRAIYAGALSYQRDGTLYTSEIRGNMYDMLASGEIHLGQSHRKEQDAPGLGNLVTTSTVDITAQVARRTR